MQEFREASGWWVVDSSAGSAEGKGGRKGPRGLKGREVRWWQWWATAVKRWPPTLRGLPHRWSWPGMAWSPLSLNDEKEPIGSQGGADGGFPLLEAAEWRSCFKQRGGSDWVGSWKGALNLFLKRFAKGGPGWMKPICLRPAKGYRAAKGGQSVEASQGSPLCV
ncbi:hypothetical protein BDDG_02055 [Blastomyces dermatitidis ATCC 18188]|uniref:Uncharacterized protein n=1 Tax=Ajellomyces dermatitidis (strain ATCC 18188 / CBS 674.68) TaxID=653446 RepID=F2T7A4_AJEDA|nr:hypothetical protein BDDG_02055 [Blastomyces dermatitidis ATCC 18188]